MKEVSSNLTDHISLSPKIVVHEYSVTNYMRQYSKRLYLSPSTKYVISIQTVTMTNVFSNTNSLQVKTPSSIGFKEDNELLAIQQANDLVMLILIPEILNATFDSMTYILVKGPNLCEQYTKLYKNLLANVHTDKNTVNDYVWEAAKVPVSTTLTLQIYSPPFSSPLSPHTTC